MHDLCLTYDEFSTPILENCMRIIVLCAISILFLESLYTLYSLLKGVPFGVIFLALWVPGVSSALIACEPILVYYETEKTNLLRGPNYDLPYTLRYDRAYLMFEGFQRVSWIGIPMIAESG